MAAIRIGTSGWIYRHWRGSFYPPKLAQRAWLEFYERHFDTVEINFSFYRLPARETFALWQERATPEFCYAVKGSRYVTHLKQLIEPEQHVARFYERLAGLGDRTGPVLWQLPPEFRRDDVRLARLLAALPADVQNTIEFRHPSWLVEPVFELLAQHRVALCIPDHPKLPQALRLTTDWTYLRFDYGGDGDGGYTPAEIDAWAERIRGLTAQGARAWVYFNNDWLPSDRTGNPRPLAIRDAFALRGRLGIGASA